VTTTIVFTHGGGRFGNQLIQFAHLIAMAEEQQDFDLVNCSFWPYANLCAGTSQNPLCFYSPAGHRPPALGRALARVIEGTLSSVPARLEESLRFRLPRLPHKYWTSRSVDLHDTWGGVDVTAFGGLRDADPPRPDWRTAETFDLSSPELVARLRRRGVVFFAGWPVRTRAAFDRHADTIRAFLGPARMFADKAQAFIAALRAQHRTLVGVQIRQQDYRSFNGGRFFFPSSQYREWMVQAARVFGPDCCLVVASDEAQPTQLLDGINAVWCTGKAVGPGHFVENIAELSLCDAILSPPSTFSGWAAFLGKVPFLTLMHAGQVVRREDLSTGDPFRIIDPPPFEPHPTDAASA